MSDTFTTLDFITVKTLYDDKNYGAAYLQIANSLPEASAEKIWFENAGLINSGLGPGSTFARTQTKLAFASAGMDTPDPQAISDGIANAVIGQVLESGDNKINLHHIFEKEAGVVVDTFGLPKHLWTFTSFIVAYEMNTSEFLYPETDSSVTNGVQWVEKGLTNALSLAVTAIEMANPLTLSDLPLSKGNAIPWFGAELDAVITSTRAKILQKISHGYINTSGEIDRNRPV